MKGGKANKMKDISEILKDMPELVQFDDDQLLMAKGLIYTAREGIKWQGKCFDGSRKILKKYNKVKGEKSKPDEFEVKILEYEMKYQHTTNLIMRMYLTTQENWTKLKEEEIIVIKKFLLGTATLLCDFMKEKDNWLTEFNKLNDKLKSLEEKEKNVYMEAEELENIREVYKSLEELLKYNLKKYDKKYK